MMIFLKSKSKRFVIYIMHPNGGRLKLGPRKKQAGFNRIHKLNHDNGEKQTIHEPHKLTLVSKTSNLENHDPERQTSARQINKKINVHHIDLTTCNVLGKKKEENCEVSGLTERMHVRDCQEVQELKEKNAQLEGLLAQAESKNQQILAENEQKNRQAIQTLMTKQTELQQKLTKISLQNQSLKSQPQLQPESHPHTHLQSLQQADKQYYQRQISRLKSQCQQIQIESAQTKFQLTSLKQQNTQKDILIKNKIQDIKTLHKQIQIQKKHVAETRVQYNQKQRGLRIALQQSQASNQILCNNVQEMNRQLQREQSSRKQKVGVIDSLQKQIDVLVARGRDSESKCLQMKRNYDQQINIHSRKLFDAESAQKNTLRESQSVINKLSTDIQNLKIKQIEQESATKMQRNREKQEQEEEKTLRIVRLEEQIKELQLQTIKKQQLINTLEQKLKTYYSPQQYTGLQRRCKELEQKRLNSARYYQQKLFNYQKQNQQLRLHKINKVNVEEVASFDQVVKNVLEESQILRAELKKANELLAQTKEEANQMRAKQKNYLNQLQILRKKEQSLSKNFGIELDVQRQKLSNEIDSLRRRLSTTETRLQYKVTQNKQKDEFIKSVIVGRSDPIDRPTIISEFQRILLQKDQMQPSQP